VRGAAAVALGQIGDAAAVTALASALTRRLRGSGFFNRLLRRKVEEDEFVRRAAAVALGQIGSREAVPVLVEALSDARAPNDVRRAAAHSLGLIGDPAAVPALRAVLAHQDPYLSRIAFEALKRLEPQPPARPAGGGL
jgi:HEAT repeat protein